MPRTGPGVSPGEFEKYLDGLGEAWWHRGRCLSYGEGNVYWALAS